MKNAVIAILFAAASLPAFAESSLEGTALRLTSPSGGSVVILAPSNLRRQLTLTLPDRTAGDFGGPQQAMVSSGTEDLGWQTISEFNTADSIVRRDGSGNFYAGTISASIVGDITGRESQFYTMSLRSESGAVVKIMLPNYIQDSYTLTLPATPGKAGQVLMSDGKGGVIWKNLRR